MKSSSSRYLSFSLLALAISAMAPGGAWSATINVTAGVAEGVTPGDGICSLREAVNNANAFITAPGSDTTSGDCATATGADIINIPAGTYTLTGAGGEDNNVSGDLDTWANVTFQGVYGA
ncbi:MAG: hypothetical protein OEY50_10515, partial [Nitrospinota bacterium]|nr:hypothetical protein [Nitrospinota bacterium]